jgi:hypothetical protein
MLIPNQNINTATRAAIITNHVKQYTSIVSLMNDKRGIASVKFLMSDSKEAEEVRRYLIGPGFVTTDAAMSWKQFSALYSTHFCFTTDHVLDNNMNKKVEIENWIQYIFSFYLSALTFIKRSLFYTTKHDSTTNINNCYYVSKRVIFSILGLYRQKVLKTLLDTKAYIATSKLNYNQINERIQLTITACEERIVANKVSNPTKKVIWSDAIDAVNIHMNTKQSFNDYVLSLTEYPNVVHDLLKSNYFLDHILLDDNNSDNNDLIFRDVDTEYTISTIKVALIDDYAHLFSWVISGNGWFSEQFEVELKKDLNEVAFCQGIGGRTNSYVRVACIDAEDNMLFPIGKNCCYNVVQCSEVETKLINLMNSLFDIQNNITNRDTNDAVPRAHSSVNTLVIVAGAVSNACFGLHDDTSELLNSDGTNDDIRKTKDGHSLPQKNEQQTITLVITNDESLSTSVIWKKKSNSDVVVTIQCGTFFFHQGGAGLNAYFDHIVSYDKCIPRIGYYRISISGRNYLLPSVVCHKQQQHVLHRTQ